MCQVREDFPVADPIFVARARDRDRGANAAISYQLDRASQLEIGDKFEIRRSTGEVRV